MFIDCKELKIEKILIFFVIYTIFHFLKLSHSLSPSIQNQCQWDRIHMRWRYERSGSCFLPLPHLLFIHPDQFLPLNKDKVQLAPWSNLSVQKRHMQTRIWSYKWTRGSIFLVCLYLSISSKFRRLYKAWIEPPFWTNLCVNTVYFTWSLPPWLMEIIVKLPPGLSATGNFLIYFYLSQQVKLTKSRCYMALNLGTGLRIVCWR